VKARKTKSTDSVRLKKYLYVLRLILVLNWIEQSTVPVRFADLLDASLVTGPVRRAIDDFLEKKKLGLENSHGSEPLNELFRKIVEKHIGRY